VDGNNIGMPEVLLPAVLFGLLNSESQSDEEQAVPPPMPEAQSAMVMKPPPSETLKVLVIAYIDNEYGPVFFRDPANLRLSDSVFEFH